MQDLLGWGTQYTGSRTPLSPQGGGREFAPPSRTVPAPRLSYSRFVEKWFTLQARFGMARRRHDRLVADRERRRSEAVAIGGILGGVLVVILIIVLLRAL